MAISYHSTNACTDELRSLWFMTKLKFAGIEERICWLHGLMEERTWDQIHKPKSISNVGRERWSIECNQKIHEHISKTYIARKRCQLLMMFFRSALSQVEDTYRKELALDRLSCVKHALLWNLHSSRSTSHFSSKTWDSWRVEFSGFTKVMLALFSFIPTSKITYCLINTDGISDTLRSF